jgi:hypothetical protein
VFDSPLFANSSPNSSNFGIDHLGTPDTNATRCEKAPVRNADFVQVESPPLGVSEHYGVLRDQSWKWVQTRAR